MILKKLYLKKFLDISHFKVWIVDGKYIRDNLNEEFTNYGSHSAFSFIPRNEFWIDRENNPGEEHFFIDSMLTIEKVISRGGDYSEALKEANKIEQRERAKSKLMRKEIKLKKTKKELIKDVHKNLIKRYSNKRVKIFVVNGELVRDFFFINFTEGGHDKVYNFIPENEVWIDDDVSLRERRFIILHELHERNLMSLGKDYGSAHKSSSKIEYFCRKHPKMLNKCIRREFKKIN